MKIRFGKLLGRACLTIAVSLAGALPGLAPANAVGAVANVTVGDVFYSPQDISIHTGDQVKWTWTGVLPHSVTSSNGLWDSAPHGNGFTYSMTFANAGSFGYYCTIHPLTAAIKGIITVQSAANVPPTVAITAPASGATFAAPWTGTIQASTSDPDGTVTNISFFAGATLLGSVPNPPASVSFNVLNLAVGNYTLTAVAKDNLGASTTSAGVTITVRAANVPPTVSITAPTSGSLVVAPWTGPIEASVADPDGTVTSISFFAGGTLLGSVPNPPASVIFNAVNLGAGSFNLTAVATDNAGASTTSLEVPITVLPANVPPSVVIIAPTGGATLAAPWNGTIRVNVFDPDGTVTDASFFAGATLLGSIHNPPANATFNLTNLAAGDCDLTSVAKDSAGASTTSASVHIKVVNAVPIMLSFPHQPSPNTFMFSYSANAGLTYRVRRSSDLQTWVFLGTNVAAGATVNFTDTNAVWGVNAYSVERLPNP